MKDCRNDAGERLPIPSKAFCRQSTNKDQDRTSDLPSDTSNCMQLQYVAIELAPGGSNSFPFIFPAISHACLLSQGGIGWNWTAEIS
jgi:hypothetical protein